MRDLEFLSQSSGSTGFPQSGGSKCAPNPTFHTRRGRQKTTHKNKQEQINNEQASQPEQTSLQARGKNSKPASQPARTNKKQQATHNKQQTTTQGLRPRDIQLYQRKDLALQIITHWRVVLCSADRTNVTITQR